jgi:hypothetical protein
MTGTENRQRQRGALVRGREKFGAYLRERAAIAEMLKQQADEAWVVKHNPTVHAYADGRVVTRIQTAESPNLGGFNAPAKATYHYQLRPVGVKTRPEGATEAAARIDAYAEDQRKSKTFFGRLKRRFGL